MALWQMLPRKNGRFTKMKSETALKQQCVACEKRKHIENQGKIFATPLPYEWTGQRLVDMKKLADGLWCKTCDDVLSLKHCIEEKRKGLGSIIKVKCPRCGDCRNINTSAVTKGASGSSAIKTEPFVTRQGTTYGRFDGVKKVETRGRGRSETNSVSYPSELEFASTTAVNYDSDPDYVANIDDIHDREELRDILQINDVEEAEPEEPEVEEDLQDLDWETSTSLWEKQKNFEGIIVLEEFQCEYCDWKHNKKHVVHAHMKEEHPEFNDLICGWCKKKFLSESTFRNHRSSHRTGGGVICETCGKQCRNEKYLEVHKLDHLPDDMAKKYSCIHCGKRFKTESYVIRHEKIHTAERTFACNLCPKKFVLKQRLEEHMQLHTGEFKFMCEICNARFTRKDNLTQHLKQNHRYVCPICNLTCTTAEEVKSHRKTDHTSEEIAESEADGHAAFYKYTDFQCNFCHRFLASKQSLNFHIATHTGEGRKRPNPSRSKDRIGEKASKVSVDNYQQAFEACVVREPVIGIVDEQVDNEEIAREEENRVDSVQKEETLLVTYNLIKIVADDS